MASEKTIQEAVGHLYRSESRRVFATLVRLLGDFDLAEEGLHDAFRAALEQWPAEGVMNTAFMMGGALGLAILASLAAFQTQKTGGADSLAALTQGYHLAFAVAAAFAALAALPGLLLREPRLNEGVEYAH